MKFLVDSFQLYLNCDQALESWLFENGLQKSVSVFGKERSSMPIIYSDNTLSTISKSLHLRKYAFPSKYYGESEKDVGWKTTYRGVKIPSENFYIDIIEEDDNIRIAFDSRSDYHLEFKYKLDSTMHQWENWLGIYLPIPTAIQIMKYLNVLVNSNELTTKLFHEKKQTTGKREDFYYSALPIERFQFTYESFKKAKKLLENQSFNGLYKGLTYQRKVDTIHPFMKIGYVHTKEEDGDFERKPQIAIKLSQRQIVYETKPRGKLEPLENTDNFITVNKRKFIYSMMSALYVCYRKMN
jgi:hypothetical protein